jgi:superfamily II helicase
MTKVTALEISVIVNIVALGSASVSVQQIASGPYEVKATQVNAVLLNLKGKGLVSRDGDTVSLTEAGVAVHVELFPVQKDLDTLRRESNAELNRPTKPSSAHELKLINDLIELRTKARRLGDSVTALEESLKPQSFSVQLQQMFPDVEFVDLKLSDINPVDLSGLPVLV